MGAGAGGGREGRRGEEREGARQGGGEDGLRGGVRGVTSARKRSVASLLAARYHSTCIAAQVRVGVYRSSAARAGRGGRVCGARGRAGGCVRAVGGGRRALGGGRRAAGLLDDALGQCLAPRRAEGGDVRLRRAEHQLRGGVEGLRHHRGLVCLGVDARQGRDVLQELLQLRVGGEDEVERREAVRLLQQLQVHVLVEVRVGEDELERVAQPHTHGLVAHARVVAAQLGHGGVARGQAVSDDPDATEWPDRPTEVGVVQEGGDGDPAVGQDTRLELRLLRDVRQDAVHHAHDEVDIRVRHRHRVLEDAVYSRERPVRSNAARCWPGRAWHGRRLGLGLGLGLG